MMLCIFISLYSSFNMLNGSRAGHTVNVVNVNEKFRDAQKKVERFVVKRHGDNEKEGMTTKTREIGDSKGKAIGKTKNNNITTKVSYDKTNTKDTEKEKKKKTDVLTAEAEDTKLPDSADNNNKTLPLCPANGSNLSMFMFYCK